MNYNQTHILIIGAGLCGSLLALRLGQHGFTVTMVEKRPDLRKEDISSGRSINLAFSDRGIKAMQLVGINTAVMKLCIPMQGRMLHDINSNTKLSPYSGRPDEYINSISRGGLNKLLLNKAEALKNVTVLFNKKCTEVDFENSIATFYNYIDKSTETLKADVIFGTDGAGSVLRKSYYLGKKFLFSFSQQYLSYGYKELSILPKNNDYQIFKNALHIWPRGNFMLIALPNLDRSFTVTLFLSYDEGRYTFNNLTSPGAVKQFFSKEFPDALAVMPNLTEDFFKNPTSPLGTVKCSPWHYKGNTLLMGDAAHAVVPFYGQGMNASFEDVVVFDQILKPVLEQNTKIDWQYIFTQYEKVRKNDTDAIADLAIDNFYEMRDHVANDLFKEKRKIEMALENTFPDQYDSKYSMVTFREDLNYQQAMILGRAQDKALLNLIADKDIQTEGNLDKIQLQSILEKIKTETAEILEEDSIAKNLQQ